MLSVPTTNTVDEPSILVDIYDNVNCLLNTLKGSVSSEIEKLVLRCVMPNSIFPMEHDTDVMTLTKYFLGTYENGPTSKQKGLIVRDTIFRKLMRKLIDTTDWRVATKASDLIHKLVCITELEDADALSSANIARTKEAISLIDSNLLPRSSEIDQLRWNFVKKRLNFIKSEWKLAQIARHNFFEENLKSGILSTLKQCHSYMATAVEVLYTAELLSRR